MRGIYLDGRSDSSPTTNAQAWLNLQLQASSVENVVAELKTQLARQMWVRQPFRSMAAYFLRIDWSRDVSWRWYVAPKPAIILVDHVEDLLVRFPESALNIFDDMAEWHVSYRCSHLFRKNYQSERAQ